MPDDKYWEKPELGFSNCSSFSGLAEGRLLTIKSLLLDFSLFPLVLLLLVGFLYRWCWAFWWFDLDFMLFGCRFYLLD